MKSDEKLKAAENHPSSLPELGRRLSAVIEVLGPRLNAARIAERSTDQLAKYIKGAVEPPFLPLARLCEAAGVRLDWLAFQKGAMAEPLAGLDHATVKKYEHAAETAPESHSHLPRQEEMIMAIQLIYEALIGRTLAVDKRAELYSIAYEMLVDGIPNAKILRFARTAVK